MARRATREAGGLEVGGRRGGVAALAAAALTGLLAGCSSGSSAGSCAYVVVFEGRSYHGVDAVGVEAGAELGEGTVPDCDDGELVAGHPLTDPVAEVVGLDPDDAIAVVHDDGSVDLLVRDTVAGDLPAPVVEYMTMHRPTDAAE